MCCFVHYITDTALTHIIQHNTQLTELDVQYCYKIKDISLIQLSQYCLNLLYLDVSGAKLITSKSLISIVENCTLLKYLDVSAGGGGGSKITSKFLETIVNFGLNITHLNISQNNVMMSDDKFEFYDATNNTLANYTANNTKSNTKYTHNLTSLYMKSLIGNACVDRIAQYLIQNTPLLTDLNLSECNITDDTVTTIAHNCKLISILNLQQCTELTDLSLIEIATHCTQLHTLI
jgi:hypothetical protein